MVAMIRALVLLAALWAHPAQALTVILYARADAAAADRARAIAAAYDATIIDRMLSPGTPWRQAIAGAISQADTVLVLWSAAASQSVEVGAEWRLALAVGRPRVIAVLLDATPLPAELGRLQAVDWR